MSARRSDLPREFIKRDRPATFTATDLIALQLPPVGWVVPDLLPEGVTLLAGKPKLGKSWMAFGLSVAVAHGGVALGTRHVEQGEVLYLALEDNKRRLQQRLNKLLNGGGAPAGLHLSIEWPRADEGGVDYLREFLDTHPGCRLVIIDTLARFKTRTTGRRSQYDEDRDAVDPLAPVAAEYGAAIVLVHHLREAESDDPLDMIHGSAGLTGGVDGALVLKRDRGRADAFLHVDGRDIEQPAELALQFDQNAATWAIAGDAEEYRLSESRAAILRVLEDADEALGPKEIAAILADQGRKIGYGTVRERLSHMVRDGQARNLGRGQYVPADLQGSRDNHDSVTKNIEDERPHAQECHDVTNVMDSPKDKPEESAQSTESIRSPNGSNGGRRLAAEEVQEVRKLTRQGMEPGLARAEVLGEEVLP